jgi:predicted RNase H-like nuclease
LILQQRSEQLMNALRRDAGVDGCRTGWIVATRTSVHVIERLETLVEDSTIDIIGVDMPIGLPDRWARAADTEARRFLGGRRASTVFPTPPRPLLHEADYALANLGSRRLFGRGLSKQAFNLLPRLREVDELARTEPEDRLVEIHPECSFRALAGAALPSKHTPGGRAARQALLRPLFGELVDARPPGAQVHDVLDAFAVLWSVERFRRGAHIEHGDGARDRYGLPMRIVT